MTHSFSAYQLSLPSVNGIKPKQENQKHTIPQNNSPYSFNSLYNLVLIKFLKAVFLSTQSNIPLYTHTHLYSKIKIDEVTENTEVLN